ncbi:hypothetical protein EGW08_012347, partial [Elysia chlorotica]
CAGIELVEINLDVTLEAQGPFDLIIHKVTDIIARANDGHVPSKNAIANLEDYLRLHPGCVVMDPLDSIRRLLNRNTQYSLVLHSDMVKDRRCTVPTFVALYGSDTEENKERLAQADVTFPLVCKPMLAHGLLAHQMSIIFNEEHLSDISPPCVVQSFINHNAHLFKVLVVGCKQYITKRPSLKNLYPGNHPTIFFDTQEVSKPDSDHPLNIIDTVEDQLVKPDFAYLSDLGQKMRQVIDMDLFGFDVIIDVKTGQYGIIDINVFPGFEAVENFFSVLLDHMVAVLDAGDKGELINGHLIPHHLVKAPVSPNSINYLNGQQLQKKDVHFNGKGRPQKVLL